MIIIIRLSKVPGGSPMGSNTQVVNKMAVDNSNENTRKSVKKKIDNKKENKIERKPIDLTDIFNMKGKNENIEGISTNEIPSKSVINIDINDANKSDSVNLLEKKTREDLDNTNNGDVKNKSANKVSFEFTESKDNENQTLKKKSDNLISKKIRKNVGRNVNNLNIDNNINGIVFQKKSHINETKGNKSISSSSIMKNVRDAIKKSATSAGTNISSNCNDNDISSINTKVSYDGTTGEKSTSHGVRKTEENGVSQPNQPLTPPRLFSPLVKPPTYSPNRVDILDAQVRAISLGK
jgi:hypothetical protein